MKKRKRRFPTKASAGVTDRARNELDLLKLRTGKSKAELVREGIELVIRHYKESGIL